MNNERNKQLIFNDLENLYRRCSEMCNTVLKSNSNCNSSFIIYKYIHLKSLFELAEKQKITALNIIYPSSKLLIAHDYEALWLEKEETLNLVADFANIHIVSNDNTKTDVLLTLPIWTVFLKKIIRLFRGIKVSHIYF